MPDDDEPTAKELQAAEFADSRVFKIVSGVGNIALLGLQTLHAEIRDAFLAGHLVSVMERLPDGGIENDLEHSLSLCAAATKGPWRATEAGDNPDKIIDDNGDYVVFAAPCGYENSTLFVDEADVAFICAAREGWPRALREVIRLRAECDEARRLAAAAVHGYDAWQALPYRDTNEDAQAASDLAEAIAEIRRKGMP